MPHLCPLEAEPCFHLDEFVELFCTDNILLCLCDRVHFALRRRPAPHPPNKKMNRGWILLQGKLQENCCTNPELSATEGNPLDEFRDCRCCCFVLVGLAGGLKKVKLALRSRAHVQSSSVLTDKPNSSSWTYTTRGLSYFLLIWESRRGPAGGWRCRQSLHRDLHQLQRVRPDRCRVLRVCARSRGLVRSAQRGLCAGWGYREAEGAGV